ncbi:hypothetical protein RH915_00050 [Serpentinicella sp. ANB-PHB4]|uniref:hypothetical protein n=1 Tax=Serpentinicella sp. ANB-PHB4 TaxID=3074076 RepID=UPI002858455C|nr:hypothetical protein [Serpentinicella sp. ANB-PHB4]MDR5657871.1 hypothetical protein [Serpentinicella sp. ANB-PHB4]
MRRRKGFKSRRKKVQFNQGIIIGIIFCIALPFSAIYLGLKITENFIVPVFNTSLVFEEEGSQKEESSEESMIFNEDEENQEGIKEENQEEIEEIKEAYEASDNISNLTVYLIQIASVTDASNINTLIEALNENDLPHAIYEENDQSKVYTFGSTKRVHVEEKIEMVREFYPEAFISEFNLPQQEVGFNSSEEEYVVKLINDINNIVELIDKQSQAWYNNPINEEKELHINLLKEHKNLVENLEEKLGEKKLSDTTLSKEHIEKFVLYQQNNINTSLELIDDEKEQYRLHGLLLDSLFKVAELTNSN